MLILPYHASWPSTFDELAGILSAGLSGLPVHIHHVGSTAVPGLPAKDIIDIDLEYPSSVSFSEIKRRLHDLDYQHHGDQGIPQREVFKRKGRLRDHPVLDGIAHHLYACPTGSPELLRHLKFRDHLRNNLSDRDKYAQLKQDISLQARHDKKTYALLKMDQAREFIEGILAQ